MGREISLASGATAVASIRVVVVTLLEAQKKDPLQANSLRDSHPAELQQEPTERRLLSRDAQAIAADRHAGREQHLQ